MVIVLVFPGLAIIFRVGRRVQSLEPNQRSHRPLSDSLAFTMRPCWIWNLRHTLSVSTVRAIWFCLLAASLPDLNHMLYGTLCRSFRWLGKHAANGFNNRLATCPRTC